MIIFWSKLFYRVIGTNDYDMDDFRLKDIIDVKQGEKQLGQCKSFGKGVSQ